MNHFRIRIQKETNKFSATHFTVFNITHAERLHGHNYAVEVNCEIQDLDELGMGFEFNTLKPHIKLLTEQWDEYVLVAGRNPYIRTKSESIGKVEHLVLEFADRSYRFPKAEVKLLPVSNITSEELAQLFLKKLVLLWHDSLSESDRARLLKSLNWLEVGVEETRGQMAIYRLSNPFRIIEQIRSEIGRTQ